MDFTNQVVDWRISLQTRVVNSGRFGAMQTDDVPGVIIHAIPVIDPAHPLAATLTIATAVKRSRYFLSRELLDDLGRLIGLELQQVPLPDSQPSTESPYELKRQTHPRVRAEAGHVVVRLELSSLRYPSDVLDIEILFAADIAATLGFELLEKAKKLA